MDLQQTKILLLSLLGLAVIYHLLTPIVLAVVIAYLAFPLFKLLAEQLKNRTVAASTVVIIVLVIIFYPLSLLVRTLAKNASSIGSFASEIIGKLSALLGKIGISTPETHAMLTQKLTSALSGLIMGTPELLIEFFVLIALIFYFLRDGDKIRAYVQQLAKNEHQQRMVKAMEQLLDGILLGYFAMAIIMGILATLGFWLIGYSHPGLFGLIIGVAALLPFIGPWLVFIPLGVLELVQGNYPLVLGLLGFGIIMQLLEAYGAPHITSKKVKIHQAIMVLGFIGGPMFFGAKGFILGPIILGTLKVVLDHYEQ